ncbi:MAG: response regulator [Desulfatiglandales bacterium]
MEERTTGDFLIEIEDLRMRLEEAEETLSAIRRGEVDALVVSGPDGERVFTLMGAERSYRYYVQDMNEGAVTLALDGAILYCNDRFAEMVETPYAKIIGDSIHRFVLSNGHFDSAFEKGKTQRCKAQVLLKRTNSDPVPVSVSLNPMPELETTGICMVVTDLTDHMHQVQQLREQADKLNERAQQLARMSSQLTLAEQNERRRIAEILHDDLQQLMVGAKISQEMLINGIGDPLKADAERVLNLINLSIKGLRSLSADLSPQVLRSGDFTASLEWLARWMKGNQNFEVQLESESRIVVRRNDLRILLFASIRELLLNVIKHAGVNSAQVKMRHESGRITVVVRDRGRGFDADQVWKRADQEQKFGLIAIRERLLHLGGRFHFESAGDGGSTFTLIVPYDDTESIEKGLKNMSEKALGGPVWAWDTDTGDMGKIRVMLVDDHIVMREALSRMLDSHSDLKVVGEATDGREAVELARRILPDVILMDISMPNMNGLEATRIIHSEFPHIRIIGLSMFEGDDQAQSMIDAGASAYRSKSDKTDHLLSAIRGRAE